VCVLYTRLSEIQIPSRGARSVCGDSGGGSGEVYVRGGGEKEEDNVRVHAP
jgi:hypothetical protein